jgi:hypothetical protein
VDSNTTAQTWGDADEGRKLRLPQHHPRHNPNMLASTRSAGGCRSATRVVLMAIREMAQIKHVCASARTCLHVHASATPPTVTLSSLRSQARGVFTPERTAAYCPPAPSVHVFRRLGRNSSACSTLFGQTFTHSGPPATSHTHIAAVGCTSAVGAPAGNCQRAAGHPPPRHGRRPAPNSRDHRPVRPGGAEGWRWIHKLPGFDSAAQHAAGRTAGGPGCAYEDGAAAGMGCGVGAGGF